MIQYPKNTHVTLPSVESWGINNNIIKDPPKSMTTRRYEPIGMTQDINQQIAGAGDRICEMISLYPRGVNPSVSVQYNNTTSSKPAYLPYRIMNGGAFRPPIIKPQDLLPLSRQPRVWVPLSTTPGYRFEQAECNKMKTDQYLNKRQCVASCPIVYKRIDSVDCRAPENVLKAVQRCSARPVISYMASQDFRPCKDPEKNIKQFIYSNVSTTAADARGGQIFTNDSLELDPIVNYSVSTNLSAHGGPVSLMPDDPEYRLEPTRAAISVTTNISNPSIYSNPSSQFAKIKPKTTCSEFSIDNIGVVASAEPIRGITDANFKLVKKKLV